MARNLILILALNHLRRYCLSIFSLSLKIDRKECFPSFCLGDMSCSGGRHFDLFPFCRV